MVGKHLWEKRMKGKVVFSGRTLRKVHQACAEEVKRVSGKQVSKQGKNRKK